MDKNLIRLSIQDVHRSQNKVFGADFYAKIVFRTYILDCKLTNKYMVYVQMDLQAV